MSKREELTGRQLGQWCVLRYDRTTIHGDTYWLCVCDCGTFKRITRGSLMAAKVAHGGCGHDAHARTADKVRAGRDSLELFNGRYVTYRTGANRRGIAFEITLPEFAHIVRQDCHYCGAPPAMLPRSRPAVAGDPCVNGVDRADNDQGYRVSNVVACCAICNRMKMDLPVDAFLAHLRRILIRSSR